MIFLFLLAQNWHKNNFSQQQGRLYFICASAFKSFFCEPCTELKVFQEKKAQNDKKATGIENIPIKFLKISAEIISALISKLLNKCFPVQIKNS